MLSNINVYYYVKLFVMQTKNLTNSYVLYYAHLYLHFKILLLCTYTCMYVYVVCLTP